MTETTAKVRAALVNSEGKAAAKASVADSSDFSHNGSYEYAGVKIAFDDSARVKIEFDNAGELSIISATVSDGNNHMTIMVGRSGFANIIDATKERIWPSPDFVNSIVNAAINNLPEEKKVHVKNWYESAAKRIEMFYAQNMRNSRSLQELDESNIREVLRR